MRILKSIFTLAIFACGMTMTAQNTDATKSTKESGYDSYKFVQIQGGVGTTFTDVNPFKLISPTASIGGGAYFNLVGVRLHVNAWESKGGFPSIADTYKFNYVNTNADLLVNLTKLFSPKEKHRFNLHLVGGLGINYAWNNSDLTSILQTQSPLDNTINVWGKNQTHKDVLGHNFRVGFLADFDISKHWSLGLEADMNSLSDRFNSKYSNSDDWMLTAQLSATYKFGHKKAQPQPIIATTPVVQEEPVQEESAPVVEEKTEPTVTPEPTPAVQEEPVQEEPLNETLYYAIRDSEINSSATITKVAEWCKKNADKKIIVSGYADKATGNPRINMRYAQERIDKVVAALKAQGVDASQIEAKAYGDTAQPFADNNKNRCVIIVGK